MSAPRTQDYFVTGTDTEIGKTLISCALLNAFASAGSTLGLKPVAAGAEWRDGEWHNEDVDRLMAASSVSAPTALVCPYLMRTPAAPHIVARVEQVQVSLATIQAAYAAACESADVVIVEGVGGFCVPLDAQIDTADLAQALALPVILVVGLRLGCINHALLTVQAIAARGLRLAGWVANTVDADMLYQAENIAALRARIAAPLLGVIPRLADDSDSLTRHRMAAAGLDLTLLN
ncbi:MULTISPECIES: dethiobiotin synthase [unclassified Undibacterium]|uniref:dethiobiotin synthase n=1 Tax=unclassified Undibacterium TaxID=2630295 RepID=UPI002AC97A74|nr:MULTISPECIES: dethiobiotin synthase [unclassified Undibacterium]MEB0138932.1 dethiobiotin synthase [Undibacterium sp. CCC2.1]MEB0171737.1 dethiobiotin synthase [Undibacterium sp. CCC1.1]MEB0175563.1 dethiobiotin synthase [Undibacterium sp. CCC3.4]MEB0214939.1 dethiobiotin synthase [Undibacterium sp. 5I2]WPX44921.1 dethiobiotin synthase [Undibacterium sp. CCC3.4]